MSSNPDKIHTGFRVVGNEPVEIPSNVNLSFFSGENLVRLNALLSNPVVAEILGSTSEVTYSFYSSSAEFASRWRGQVTGDDANHAIFTDSDAFDQRTGAYFINRDAGFLGGASWLPRNEVQIILPESTEPYALFSLRASSGDSSGVLTPHVPSFEWLALNEIAHGAATVQ